MALELGVLVSGNGTNLQAILDAVRDDSLSARCCLVISNKASAFALERARRAGVPVECIPHTAFESREAFDEALVQRLRAANANWIVLAGFMRVLTSGFLRAFAGKVVNIHPSLLPAFPGANAQRQALEYGVKVSGCTVHLVDDGVDTGPILAQRAVPVRDDDDEHALAARIQVVEHALLVEVLQAIAEERIVVRERGEGIRPTVTVKPA